MVGIRYLGTLLFLFFLFFSPAYATINVDLFQITTDGSPQRGALIYGDQVVWSDFRSSSVDIWGYDLRNKTELPILVKDGDQFVGALNNRFIIYNQILSLADPNAYDIWAYDFKKNQDIELVSGLGTQMATDIYHNKVVYTNGYGSGDIYVYDMSQKTKQFIALNGSDPKIWGRYLVWYTNIGGLYDIRAYDLTKNQLVDIPNPNGGERAAPDIYYDSLIYFYAKDGTQSIRLFDISTGSESILTQTSTYDIGWPSISKKYAVWSKSTAPNIGGLDGINLKTGEVFEVQSQGPQQNSITPSSIWKNTAVWMSWRTGNGDIYGATFKK